MSNNPIKYPPLQIAQSDNIYHIIKYLESGINKQGKKRFKLLVFFLFEQEIKSESQLFTAEFQRRKPPSHVVIVLII